MFLVFIARRYSSAVFAVVVCPSVYHKPVPGYHIETIGRIELVFGMEASTCLTLCYKEIWVSSKIRVLPSGTLSQTPDLKNLVTISRPRCQQNLSSSLSTVEPVDDTYTTIIINFLLFTAGRSSCNSLTLLL